eukprot:TRINITY_DN7476_c0_g1_i2.p1 TRINITY_DN7476_c0_g1~~TRINITY_DN7476_c0_g1_i2.p1  ORF type:complete len:163 (+),score=29.08 TRINITY_DN7476_c0_g1_i2:113-601(+)
MKHLKTTTSALIKEPVAIMLDDLTKRWSNIPEELKTIMMGCCVLDPRCKELNFFNNNEKTQAFDWLKKEYLAMHHIRNTMEPPKKKAKTFLESVLLPNQEFTLQHDGFEEISEYCLEPNFLVGDPLLWWHQKKLKFPILSLVAKKWLAMPATSVPQRAVVIA